MSCPVITLLAAVAENGVIGRDNDLPWRLRTDLRRFRQITWGKPLIMGRRNWESIGRPLPGRETVVLSRQPGFGPPGAHVACAWEDARAQAAALASRMGVDEICVVGGAEIYRLALPETDRMHLTRVHARPAGDVLFPRFDGDRWTEIWRESHPAGGGDEYPFTFVELSRRDGDRPAFDAAGR